MIFLKLIWFYPISFAPQQIKTSFFLHSACRNLEFRSLIRTSELCSKVLSLGNSQINLVLPNFFRASANKNEFFFAFGLSKFGISLAYSYL